MGVELVVVPRELVDGASGVGRGRADPDGWRDGGAVPRAGGTKPAKGAALGETRACPVLLPESAVLAVPPPPPPPPPPEPWAWSSGVFVVPAARAVLFWLSRS